MKVTDNQDPAMHTLAAAFGAADAAKEQDLRGYYPMAARVLAEEVRRLKAERDALAREAHTWSKAAETYAADAGRMREALQSIADNERRSGCGSSFAGSTARAALGA